MMFNQALHLKLQAAQLGIASAMAAAATMGAPAAAFSIPLPVILFAFCGSMLALSWLELASRRQIFVAVSGGMFVGVSGSTLITDYFQLGVTSWACVAGIGGLTAHLLITFLFKDGPSTLKKIILAKFNVPPDAPPPGGQP